jgi:ADP-heptose:LPS heptosyltransferase
MKNMIFGMAAKLPSRYPLGQQSWETIHAMDRILFITSNRIGDAVLSSGVLAQLIAAHPGAQVTVACGPLPAPLFADTPGLALLHPIVKRRGRRIGHWWALWRAVAAQRWTVVVDVRSHMFAWTVLAKKRMVCRTDTRHEHRIEELARQLGLETLPAPQLAVSAARQDRVDTLLGAGPPLLAIGPTANWGAKQWPIERYAATALQLTGPTGILPGARIAVFGAAHERAAALPLLQALPAERTLDFVGLPDLLDAYAMLRKSSFYIGNDSGLMHMAAAAGAPTLGLFGPSEDWRYGPWGSRTALVRTPQSYVALTGAADFDWRRQDCLMTGLSVDAVLGAAESLWSRVTETTITVR